jgi:diadenosine tetraphosphatase ApaH/serine/threonine PP2A family protein phosphatase
MSETPTFEIVNLFFSNFETFLTSDEDPSESIGLELPIPTFAAPLVSKLLNASILRFQQQPTLLEITGECILVGDLHGNLQDLVRIIRLKGLEATYIFLGDYVDRGQFSPEVILFLLTLTCKYPDTVYLLRGNHECCSIASSYGFRTNILELYNEQLFSQFVEVFDWFPLAAIVNNTIFCVHGGIDPTLHSVQQIAALERPLDLEACNPLARRILWADPTKAISMFREGIRDGGIEFGPLALRNFLGANSLKVLVRAHQCVPEGVEFYEGMPVVTVFSTSNYYALGSNSCGILTADESGALRPETLPPIRCPTKRGDASFYTVDRARSSDVSPLPPLLTLGSCPSRVGPTRPLVSVATNVSLPGKRRSPSCQPGLGVGSKIYLLIPTGLLATKSGRVRAASPKPILRRASLIGP